MRPDFARIKGVPLEVILLLDNIGLEDDAAEYLMDEYGLVTAWGHVKKAKLVLTAPDNPDFAYFRVRVKYPNHPRRPFLDFKYLSNFYKTPEFPGQNPMKEVLVATFLRYRGHIIGVTNHSLEPCKFPYELSSSSELS